MKIGFLGIGGTGVRALAHILHAQGATIVGTDATVDQLRSDTTLRSFELLDEADFIAQLPSCDRLVHTDAAPTDHPVIAAAQEEGLRVLKYNEALGELSRDYRTVAVAGTHGKSSTTALLAHILIEAGCDPTVIVGAPIPAFDNANARVGNSDILVVEADEYRDHFLTLAPAVLIVTNIEHDHPDHFPDVDAVRATFDQLLQRVTAEAPVITTRQTNGEHNISWPATIETPEPLARDQAANLFGEHMRSNAALAIAAAAHFGVSERDAVAHLKTFAGVGRRLEQLGSIDSLHILSDYGHHPTEVAATLAGMRERYEEKRVCAIWEPHTLERVNQFGDAFVTALGSADGVVVAPIYAPQGRDTSQQSSITNATAQLQDSFSRQGISATFLASFDDLPTAIRELGPDYDVCIGFSAGVLDKHLRELI